MSISFIQPPTTELKPRIVVFGVGGAGGNAVNNMIESGLEGVEFVTANTDAQQLAFSKTSQRIQLGVQVTQGLGAGAHPEVGMSAAEESAAEIGERLDGAHMVFITAGMGGGTGTGAAPIIAKCARERGILTVGVVTKPFHFEGRHRMRLADAGIAELQRYVDTLIVIPNQNLFRLANEKTTFSEAFGLADKVLDSGVRSITDLMILPGLINLDFADDDPAFDVGAAAAEDLFALCRAGDGVPRYIEAAARAVSALGLRETAIAVSEEPTVLDAFLRPGDGAERSESVLALALAVLSEPAAGLVRGLALLESGADLRFAADLFAEGRLSHIAAPAAELVAHSLVRSQTVAGHRRLQVPLHYRVQLQAQLSEEDRTRHETALRRGLLDRLRRCAATWFSESQLEEVQFLNRHAADVAALLSAMSTDPDDAREALEIISSLRYYWQLHPVDPWPRARDWLQSALALDHEGDAVTLRAVLTDAYIAFHEGDVHGARTRLEAVSHEQCAAAADAAERNFADFLQALVLLGEGEVDRAQSELRQVLQASLEQGTLDHLGEKYWYLAACHIAAGDQDEALEILEEGLAYCERLGEQLGRAYMLCLLALASDRRGSHDEAVRRVRESAQVMAQFGDRAGLALCLKLLSAFSARSGQDGTPAQSARLAAALTDGRALALPSVPIPEFARSSGTGPDVPAPHWEDSALREVLAGIIGAAQPSSPGGARAGAAGAQSVLSARESEIAALVAEGLGNPAIAARLVLSRRTVEGHVQRILAKLGFRSRSQIAVWAAQHAAADTTL